MAPSSLTPGGNDTPESMASYLQLLLMQAPEKDHPDMLEKIEALVLAGANINQGRDEGFYTPLMSAVSFQHPKVVALLLSHGADPNAVYRDRGRAHVRYTALMLSISIGHKTPEASIGIVKDLLAHGADTAFTNQDGSTPLSLARNWKFAAAEAAVAGRIAEIATARRAVLEQSRRPQILKFKK